MDFSGKVILVTGASSGIGAAAAELFAKCGGRLILVGRNLENLEETSKKCKSLSTAGDDAEPVVIQADVNKESDIEIIMTMVRHKCKRLDVLVNAAGIIENGSIENTSLQQYDRVMQTNVRSLYHLTMMAVPELVKTKGNIINVSSVCGLRSFPGVLAYNMSKSAVDQFTRCVALELAQKGVRCNSVNPGVIVTELHKRGGMDEEAYAKFLEHSKTTHALGRAGEVHEVANAICFLASEQASFMTGVNMPVDGGRHAMCPR